MDRSVAAPGPLRENAWLWAYEGVDCWVSPSVQSARTEGARGRAPIRLDAHRSGTEVVPWNGYAARESGEPENDNILQIMVA